MRHVADGVLRRLEDEPLAVPDRVIEHAAVCQRCRARRAEIAQETGRAARLLAAPRLVPDVDMAWARLQRELFRAPEPQARRRGAPPVPRRALRFPRTSLRTGLIMAAVAVAVVGTAAAATLTTIFAPTRVAPVSVTQGDVRAIASVIGLDDRTGPGSSPTHNRSTTTRFGTIKWDSSGSVRPASSPAQASTEAGFPVSLPRSLPAGVGAVKQLVVHPRIGATVTFNSTAGSLGGSAVTVEAGPVVLAEYAGAGGTELPTLVVATMPRPTARSSGATLAQIEAFLLGQPGVPPQLAEEVRLLGDLRTTLPVPVPAGASVRSVQVAGWPGVLVSDSSNAAGLAVWENGRGVLHVVAGILDARDLLNVARQLT